MLWAFIASASLAAGPPAVEREDPVVRFQRQYGPSFRDDPFKTIDRLAEGSDPDASEMLEVIVAERETYRWRALDALTARLNKRKDLEALDALGRHFNRPDPGIRWRVRSALVEFIGNHAIGAFEPAFLRDEVVPKLEELLKKAPLEPDPDSRFWLEHLESAIERWRRDFSPEGYERRNKELAEQRRREAERDAMSEGRHWTTRFQLALVVFFILFIAADWVKQLRDARP